MTGIKKRIFVLIPLVILIVLVGVYFLFPGALFDFLKEAERSAGGLEQRSIDLNGLHIGNNWRVFVDLRW